MQSPRKFFLFSVATLSKPRASSSKNQFFSYFLESEPNVSTRAFRLFCTIPKYFKNGLLTLSLDHFVLLDEISLERTKEYHLLYFSLEYQCVGRICNTSSILSVSTKTEYCQLISTTFPKSPKYNCHLDQIENS